MVLLERMPEDLAELHDAVYSLRPPPRSGLAHDPRQPAHDVFCTRCSVQ
jgi:hypothetical protein